MKYKEKREKRKKERRRKKMKIIPQKLNRFGDVSRLPGEGRKSGKTGIDPACARIGTVRVSLLLGGGSRSGGGGRLGE
jgi:hypothetical protein